MPERSMQTDSNEINETRSRIFKDARDAQRLLDHPKIKGFLETERTRVIAAYKSLPMEAPHAQYMALKIYLNQLDEFEMNLRRYVRQYDDFEAINEKDFL